MMEHAPDVVLLNLEMPSPMGADESLGRMLSLPSPPSVVVFFYNAEDRDHAEQAAKAFGAAYGAKWPKAVAKITNDLDVLLASTTSPVSTGSSLESFGARRPSGSAFGGACPARAWCARVRLVHG